MSVADAGGAISVESVNQDIDVQDELANSFKVSLPNGEVLQVTEMSLEEDEIPDIIMQNQETKYEIIKGGSHKGNDLLADSCGFTYVKKRVSNVATTWICSVRCKTARCSASVSPQKETFTRGSHDHNHAGDPGASLRLRARANVKDEARLHIFKPSGKIVTDTLINMETEGVPLPMMSYLQRSANRVREQLRPKHPADLEF